MDYVQVLQEWTAWFLGWPIIFYVVPISILCTFFLGFVQIRYFFTAWKLTLCPSKEANQSSGEMTSLQAFLNTLSANLGNGSLAGMATAVYAGGPGAALWVVIIGLLLMSVRFVEVFLGADYSRERTRPGLGGPMLYMKDVPGGSFLLWTYAIVGTFFGIIVGNGIQANSVCNSVTSTWGVYPIITAVILLFFSLYIVSGGAQRVAKASEAIVPIKVILFFSTSLFVLCYHYQNIPQALHLIVQGACGSLALAGGVVGFCMQQAIRFGMSRSIMATESGLGTAAILYGATGSKEPVKDAIMSMLSTLISTIVCFIIGLAIVASGVWSNGMTGIALTIATYQTVFGAAGGWIVSFLSISFGIGVLVAFAYIGRETWFFVTGGRYGRLFEVVYCIVSFVCALASVELVWIMAELSGAIMLIANLWALVWLLPRTKRALKAFKA